MAWQLCLLIGLFGITFGAPDPYPGCVDSTKLNCTEVKHQVCTFDAAYHICPRTCNLCDRNPIYHPCKDHVQGIKCADFPNPCSDSVGLISCPKFCGICSSSTPTNPPPTSIKTTPFPVTAPTQAHFQPDDPCDPINHDELNDSWRSTGFMNAYPERPHCDNHLIQGWYRFTSAAGGTMPTTPPSRQRCGTVIPIWINGTLPSVGNKVESRACANLNHGADECEHSFPIWVKNCGGYFVYYLHPIPTCPVAYCAAPTNPPPTSIKTTPFPVTAPTQAHFQPNDPCDPINHNELDDSWRNTGFMNAYPETPHCDIHLIQGWYRFTSAAGGTMPTTPPSRRMCGTGVPIWINGTLPSVGNQVESRACANLNQGADECEHSFPIWVKNCRGYFVYYLRPIPTCPVAYCAGSSPTLTGPNDDHIYTCAFTPNFDFTVTVTWLVKGVGHTSSKTYGTGASEALISAWGLPTYGQLTCQVTVNGVNTSSAPITLSF